MFKKFFLFFLFVFLLSFFFGSEALGLPNHCTLADGSQASPGTSICGGDLGGSRNEDSLYTCVLKDDDRLPDRYIWESAHCGSRRTCTNARCVDEAPRDCSSGSTTGPPARSWPSANHGQSVCTTSGASFEYVCNDGQWSSTFCGEAGCFNGTCGDDDPTPGNGNGNGNGDPAPGNGDPAPGNGDPAPGNGGTIPGGGSPPQLEGVFQVIYNGVRFFFGFIAIVAAAMVVYGAYMWMASGGDPQKTKMAQGVLTWAVIGLIFFMTFWFFFDFILGLFGIKLPTPSGTGLF